MKQANKLIRKFAINTRPSPADPEWVIAMWELPFNEEEKAISFSDYNILTELIKDCEIRRIESAAIQREYMRICEMFGFKSPLEMEKAAREYKEKNEF